MQLPGAPLVYHSQQHRAHVQVCAEQLHRTQGVSRASQPAPLRLQPLLSQESRE